MKTPFLLVMLSLGACASAQELAPISSPHVEKIQAWLTAHPGYRLATAADCHCDEDIESLRKGDGAAWEPQPDFHPYLDRGDFDGDGSQDVAVVAIASDKRAKIYVLVSLDTKKGRSADLIQIARDETSVADRGIFVRWPQSASKAQHSRLLFGAFGSEAEEIPIERHQPPR
jgi:hypothetical protein